MYRYYFYGLHVESEIEIEEVLKDTTDAAADVKVTFSEFPEDVLKIIVDKKDDEYYWVRSKAACSFRIANVADYYISKDEIRIRLITDIDNHDIRCFLLGSAFGYLMAYRNVVAIHGGAVTKNGKGIIVTGESGAGKSTVTNALRAGGYDFIADDVCAITEIDGKPHINLAYPQAKLCRDAALNLGYELSDLIYINEDRDKFAVRLKDRYVPEGRDFNLLFEIVLSDEDELSFEEVKGSEALKAIHENLYRANNIFEGYGVPPQYMMKCLKIAGNIAVYRIKRPKDVETLDEILKFIDETVG